MSHKLCSQLTAYAVYYIFNQFTVFISEYCY